MKRIFVLIFTLILLLAGCSTMNVSLRVANKVKLNDVQKIALIKVAFSEREIPLLPLFDAGIYNLAIQSSAEDFSKINVATAAAMTSLYADTLLSLTGKDILLVKNTSPYTGFDVDDAYLTKSEIQKIAKEHQTELVIAITVKVITAEISDFGIRGSSYLNSVMSVYNTKGDLVGQAYFNSNSDWSDPKSMKAYQKLIDSYQVLGPQMTELLF